MSVQPRRTRWLPSAVFLDRDGTIVRDTGYLSDPGGVELLPGTTAAIQRLNEAGIPVVIVTNQSGIGRGYYGEDDFEAVQAAVERALAVGGARIDAVYHCPHSPGVGCACRKPELELYERAADDLGIDLSRSVYVGDRDSDVRPALRTGGMGLLVADGEGRYDDSAPRECSRMRDLAEAVSSILGEAGGTQNP